MVFNNPVLSKEYRLRMRSRRTSWIVTGYLLVMGCIILNFIYLQVAGGYFEIGIGRELFVMISVLQLGMIGFVTPGLTAGQISGERERQTLAVLLTTNLSPSAIITSKLVASLSFMLLLVIATLPLYAIVFLFGGVSFVQVSQIFVFYLVAMLFLGSLGLMYSTIVQRTGIATVLTYGTMAAIIIGTAIAGYFSLMFHELGNTAGFVNPPLWVSIWFLLNPVYSLFSLFEFADELTAHTGINPYVFYLTVYVPLSVLFLVIAARRLSPIRKRRRRKQQVDAALRES